MLCWSSDDTRSYGKKGPCSQSVVHYTLLLPPQLNFASTVTVIVHRTYQVRKYISRYRYKPSFSDIVITQSKVLTFQRFYDGYKANPN